MRHSERHNCATSDMRSNSRKLRRQKECRSQIGTRRMSDRDCRSDSSRPHLLTARTHGGVVSVTSRRGVSARCLRGLMLALGSPIVKPVRAKSSGSSQGHSQHTARFQRFRALKPRHQQLHALRGAVDSGICQVTAPPLVNRQGATDPPHSFEVACDFDTATRVHDHHEEATPPAPETFPATMPLDCATW